MLKTTLIKKKLRFFFTQYSFRFATTWILSTIVLMVAACTKSTAIQLNTPTLQSSKSPQVVATAWTAEIIGTLVVENGCIQLNDENNKVYTLVWPPDLAVTIENDEVIVTRGIVTGNREDILFHFGDTVYLSGGETEHLSEDLQKTVSEQCTGPYWVIGFDIKSIQTTDEP